MDWILKNKKRRNLLKKTEIKKLMIKSLLINNKSNFFFKLYYDKIFKKINNNASISKIRNYCLYLNNSRSIFRKFKLSRHKIKILAANSYITGLKKSSF
jgi:ribosomal protein S14